MNNPNDQTAEVEHLGAEIFRKMKETFRRANKNVDGHLQYTINEYKENGSKDCQKGELVVIFQPNKSTAGTISN